MTPSALPDGTRVQQRNVFIGQTSNSSLSVNHRLTSKSSANVRVSHSEGNTALTQAGASAICSKMQFDRIQSIIDSVLP